jgi:hypothetical protein
MLVVAAVLPIPGAVVGFAPKRPPDGAVGVAVDLSSAGLSMAPVLVADDAALAPPKSDGVVVAVAVDAAVADDLSASVVAGFAVPKLKVGVLVAGLAEPDAAFESELAGFAPNKFPAAAAVEPLASDNAGFAPKRFPPAAGVVLFASDAAGFAPKKFPPAAGVDPGAAAPNAGFVAPPPKSPEPPPPPPPPNRPAPGAVAASVLAGGGPAGVVEPPKLNVGLVAGVVEPAGVVDAAPPKRLLGLLAFPNRPPDGVVSAGFCGVAPAFVLSWAVPWTPKGDGFATAFPNTPPLAAGVPPPKSPPVDVVGVVPVVEGAFAVDWVPKLKVGVLEEAGFAAPKRPPPKVGAALVDGVVAPAVDPKVGLFSLPDVAGAFCPNKPPAEVFVAPPNRFPPVPVPDALKLNAMFGV